MPGKVRTMSAPLSRIRAVPRRGLSRDEACQYVGVSATIFDRMVRDGRMPRPKKLDGRQVFDLYALDRAFDALPDAGEGAGTGWEDVA
jgi:excisionase family DNA binding protein